MHKPKRNRPTAPKKARVKVRMAPEQKEIVSRAAHLQQTSLSNFLVEQGYRAAQQVLAEQVHFVLPPDRWQAFCVALDAPPREIPALRKLLTGR